MALRAKLASQRYLQERIIRAAYSVLAREAKYLLGMAAASRGSEEATLDLNRDETKAHLAEGCRGMSERGSDVVAVTGEAGAQKAGADRDPLGAFDTARSSGAIGGAGANSDNVLIERVSMSASMPQATNSVSYPGGDEGEEPTGATIEMLPLPGFKENLPMLTLHSVVGDVPHTPESSSQSSPMSEARASLQET